MKYRTVLERQGEKLGPIDWSHDFSQYFSNRCCPEDKKMEAMEDAVAQLKAMELGLERGEHWQVYTGCVWQDVLDVGMYDGWPFWRAVPSYALRDSTLGGTNWHHIGCLTFKGWTRQISAASSPVPPPNDKEGQEK